MCDSSGDVDDIICMQAPLLMLLLVQYDGMKYYPHQVPNIVLPFGKNTMTKVLTICDSNAKKKTHDCPCPGKNDMIV